MLEAWCTRTPQGIFPNRKIGALRDGYEGSFVVLDANPLTDFHATERIRLRVKKGRRITVPPTPTAFPPIGG
jgi:imidazolonepropionase-like amidohydrolase